MKIYTQMGDSGQTSLLSGQRVSKSHPRVQVGGEVDELNSAIGAIVAFWPDVACGEVRELRCIQTELLDVCAWVSAADAKARTDRLEPFGPERCRRLEALIDAMSAGLPSLKGFVLPGGHPAAALAHVARCICRRAERSLVQVAESDTSADPLGPILAYLNRLSDYLFVLARHLNQAVGVADQPWTG